MRKHTPQLEWQIVENQENWEAAMQPPAMDRMPSTPVPHRRLYRRYIWSGLSALLLLLTIAGNWVWHTAHAGLDQIEGELSSAVQIELTSVEPVLAPRSATWATDAAAMAWEKQLERERDTLHTLLLPDIPANQQITDAEIIILQDDQAVTEFVTTSKDERQAYRQTRFYRQTADGWQRTRPDAELWGALRRLESSHFIFHFRQHDAAVIAAVAPQIDVLYTQLQHNFGLTPSIDKLVIEVTVDRITGAIPTPQWDREPLVVPSPALYLAPAELSNSALLAQSIALPLLQHMAERAIRDHAVPPHWQPLLYSLTLWQLWNLEMPLAYWRHDVVTWLYTDVSTDDTARHSMLADRYAALCAMHSIWMLSPDFIGIPLECIPLDDGTWRAARKLLQIPHTHLEQFITPLKNHYEDYSAESDLFPSTDVVIIAILLEYAVAAYGYEQLPVLLAHLAQYDEWETLLPAVYGISSSEFEKGWQAYLVKEYGVQPYLLRP